MNVTFALFADAANISQEGKLNVLGVFDAIQVASLPTVHPRATLVVRLKGTRADVGTHTLGMRWLNPQGNELWSSSGQLEVGAPPGAAADMDLPLIASLDLPVDMAGAYRLNISFDDEPAAEVKLQVRGSVQNVMPASNMVS